MALDLTTTEWQRYARHLALDEIGTSGQLALKNARVLVVGCGGLGSPLALYLAAAGVGNLTLVDGDSVELSNLQRQILFGDRQLGAAKAIAGAERLQALNGDIEVTPIAAHLDTGNGPSLIAEADLVVDCSDNFRTRFALNRAAVAAGKPLVSGAAIRAEGQLSVFDSRSPGAPCYHCLYQESEELDASCSSNGVLAPLVGVIGSLQALECLKLLSGFGEPLTGRLLLFDAATLQFREMRLAQDPQCPVCSRRAD